MQLPAFLGSALCLVFVGLLSGCGQQAAAEYPKQEGMHRVTGRVEFQGEPIHDATVRLIPADAKKGDPRPIPSGMTLSDGTFHISTFNGDERVQGVPEGEYRMELSWKGPLQGLSETSVDELKERLPKKYTHVKTSGLTCTVTSGENTLPLISLKSP